MSGKVVTGGKPYQSRLAPYEAEIDRLRLDGASIRGIAAEMFSRTSPSSRQGIGFADSLRLGDMRRRGAEVFLIWGQSPRTMVLPDSIGASQSGEAGEWCE